MTRPFGDRGGRVGDVGDSAAFHDDVPVRQSSRPATGSSTSALLSTRSDMRVLSGWTGQLVVTVFM